MICLILSSMFICFLVTTIVKILNRVWWTPMRVVYHLRRHGIEGPTYKVLHGNTKEISHMRRESMSKPMDDLSHEIFPRILPHIHSWRNLYGPNFLYWLGPKAQLVITEVKLVKEILTNNDNYPKLDLEGYSKKLLGDGLSSSKGEKWANMRKLANHAFHAESLKNMIPAMITSVEEMLVRWKEHEGKEVEVFEEFRVLTSEIISKTAFGSSYMEGKKIFEMLIKLALIVARNALKIRFPGISKILKTSDEIESEKLEQGIKDCITQIIKKREQAKDEGDYSRNDFLEKLLEANSHETENSKWLSVEDMVDECKTLYFAGHETTTSMLGWTILLLAIQEDWQEKARQEVMELCGRETPNADGISRMKIMNMILEESLRLYPPVPAIKRKVDKEMQLGKLILPPQTELCISPLALQHDPETWGEDVHCFKPERFSRGVVKATNNNPVAFLPFGFGPRTCVGLNFAITEAKIALSMILQRYRFTLSPTYIHSPVQAFMICPQHGVQVILHGI